ncbi:MAG: sugar transferase [Oscillospiraceae bacterium]
MYKNFVKRLFDIVASFFGIIILSPFLLILSIWIKCDSKGAVLFKQKRVGKNKTFFNILKFRTMYSDTPKDVPTHLLKDPNKMITKSGSFLRKYSLDELPQIFNIFVGQMSIIGPRPALYNQDDLIAQRDKYGANNVVPGLTGYAQITGRDELPIDEKAKKDGYYAKNISFKFDMEIFFKTILRVFKASGVVEGEQENTHNADEK